MLCVSNGHDLAVALHGEILDPIDLAEIGASLPAGAERRIEARRPEAAELLLPAIESNESVSTSATRATIARLPVKDSFRVDCQRSQT